MRTLLQIAFALIVAAGISVCGDNNTYSPSFLTPGTPDFTVSAAPPSNNATQGNPTNYTVTVTSIAGFAAPLTLSVSGLPAGAAGSFSTNPVTPTANGANSTLNITTTGGNNPTPVGSYTLTITASGGNITHQTTVTLVIDAAPPTQGGLNGTIQ